MPADQTVLLEIRLFKVKPGNRAEFDRISREGTIPLMRRLGIEVVAHGPSLEYDDTYYLVRAFATADERVERGQRLYKVAEWQRYDKPVSSMIDDYSTALLEVPRPVVDALVLR